jgi:hypothetical protein
MQVPYHGDFANANPSIIVRLRWWAREFRTALAAAPRPETPLCGAKAEWDDRTCVLPPHQGPHAFLAPDARPSTGKETP